MDDETKLTLHGLQQHYVKLQDREKNRKLFDLLDALEFNQVGCALIRTWYFPGCNQLEWALIRICWCGGAFRPAGVGCN